METMLPVIVLTVTSVFQFISSGIGISTAQNILNNRLIAALPHHAPGVDASTVLNAGATKLQDVFAASDILGIQQSYIIGLRAAWTLSIALAGMTLFLTLLLGWKSNRPSDVYSAA